MPILSCQNYLCISCVRCLYDMLMSFLASISIVPDSRLLVLARPGCLFSRLIPYQTHVLFVPWYLTSLNCTTNSLGTSGLFWVMPAFVTRFITAADLAYTSCWEDNARFQRSSRPQASPLRTPPSRQPLALPLSEAQCSPTRPFRPRCYFESLAIPLTSSEARLHVVA